MTISTIYALSSGFPPAGIAVIRISGPAAGDALRALAGQMGEPRVARLAWLRDPHTGVKLDQALTFWFPGPASVTGEDMAELHVHGGRAVVAAVLAALGKAPGLRAAVAGEFTRRAFDNGRIDLSQAEGLADLLAAETESQRQSALMLAEGRLGKQVARWQKELLTIAAIVEASLDFSDEDDVGEAAFDTTALRALHADINQALSAPGSERLKDGIRLVLAGPPNAGKSSLLNHLAGRDAAIVTEIAGTTRDVIEAPVVLRGIPFVLTDTAGLHDAPADKVEALGVALAASAIERADIILWLGDEHEQPSPERSILIAAKADLGTPRAGLPISSSSGEGIATLIDVIVERAQMLLPKPGALALNERHQRILSDVSAELQAALSAENLLITAECLRLARRKLDALTGRAGVEDMLDALFGGFCIGK